MKVISFLVLVIATSLLIAQPAEKLHTKESYINTYKDIAIEEMIRTGIPASITLAQALFESSNGNSTLAMYANNHFGIKCHGEEWNGEGYHMYDDAPNECFRVYNSVQASFIDHSNFIKYRKWYKPLFKLRTNDYNAWAHGLKQCGYATYPTYAQTLISLIKKYQLYRYDYIYKKNSKRISIPKESMVIKKVNTITLISNKSNLATTK